MWFAFIAGLVLSADPPEETATSKTQLVEHLREMVQDSRAPARNLCASRR